MVILRGVRTLYSTQLLQTRFTITLNRQWPSSLELSHRNRLPLHLDYQHILFWWMQPSTMINFNMQSCNAIHTQSGDMLHVGCTPISPPGSILPAELQVICIGLEKCAQHHLWHVEVRTDSQLVAAAVSGKHTFSDRKHS